MHVLFLLYAKVGKNVSAFMKLMITETCRCSVSRVRTDNWTNSQNIFVSQPVY
jgi:hypothetical protein